MKKILNLLLALAAMGLFGYTVWFLYTKSAAPPKPVELVQPQRMDITRSMTLAGTIKPEQEVKIKSQIPGVIEELYVEAGQMVKAGQPVARLKLIPEMTSLNEAEFEVNRRRLLLNQATQTHARQKQLFDAQAITTQEMEQYVLEKDLASQNLAMAESNLKLLKEGVSKTSGARFDVVRATTTGMVLEVPEKVGNYVIQSNNFNEGTTLAVVANLQDMIFEGVASEAEVGKLKTGAGMELTVAAMPGTIIPGSLFFISPQGKNNNGNMEFQIKARINAADAPALRAGYSANGKIVLEEVKQVLAVKESCVMRKDGKMVVEVLRDSAMQQYDAVPVVLGTSDDIHVEIKSGLTGAERIKLYAGKDIQAPKK